MFGTFSTITVPGLLYKQTCGFITVKLVRYTGRPCLLVSRLGACLGAGAVVSILSKLLVLVAESLLALAASLAAPLAAPGMSSTLALAAMPLFLVVDGEGRYSSLQSCLLSQGGLLLQCGRLDGRHHRLIGVSGFPDDVSKLGQLPHLQLVELDGHQILEVPWEAVEEDRLEEMADWLIRRQGPHHHLQELRGSPAAQLCSPQDAGTLI